MAKGLYINPSTFVPLNQISEHLTTEIATRQFALGGYTGFFNYLPDPDPILRKLGADQTIYKDLLADDQVGPLYNRRKNLTKSKEWHIKPNDAGDAEVELCEMALQSLEDNGCKIKDIISQSLNPIGFGYSVFELRWNTSVKPWLPVSAWEKNREWFFFDSRNQLRFRSANNYEGTVIIGEEADPKISFNFILLQNDPSYENPYGDKVLSRCFWPVTFKRGGMKFFSVFIEKYGMPYLFGKLPRGAKPEEHNDLLSKLHNMVQDAVGTGPDDSSLQLIEAKGTQSADLYDKYLQRCDNAITKSILLNALSTDIQQSGARASSETGAETIEGDIGETDPDFPVSFFNTLFKRVVDINIGSKKYPTFEFIEVEESKKTFAERDKLLSESFSASGQKIKRTKSFLVNNYNYKEDEFEIEETTSPDLPPLTKGRAGEGFPEPLKNEPTPPVEMSLWNKFKKFIRLEFQSPQSPQALAQQLVDNVPDKLLQFQMEEVLQPIIELAKKSDSREQFINSLAAQYPSMNTKQIEDLAAKVFFIADIEGRKDASGQ